MDPLEFYSSSEWRTSRDAIDGLAWRALNFSSLHPPRLDGDRQSRCIPRLRLTEDPGHSREYNPFTPTVDRLYPYDGTALAVREAVWRRSADHDRARDIVAQHRQSVAREPTVVIRDGAVPVEPFDALLREANGFRLPVTWFNDSQSISSASWD